MLLIQYILYIILLLHSFTGYEDLQMGDAVFSASCLSWCYLGIYGHKWIDGKDLAIHGSHAYRQGATYRNTLYVFNNITWTYQPTTSGRGTQAIRIGNRELSKFNSSQICNILLQKKRAPELSNK
jgi:hypothetical protein